MKLGDYNSGKAKRRHKKLKEKYGYTILSGNVESKAHRKWLKATKEREKKQLKMSNRKNMGTELGTAIEVMFFLWYEFFQLCLELPRPDDK